MTSTIDRLVLASHNEGKLAEFKLLLAPYGVEVVSAVDIGLDEPEETGSTFEENAILKARAAVSVTGLPSLADDSGICVEALGGEPGIYSARWAGEPREFGRAMETVDEKLRDVGATEPEDRRACIVSVLSLALPDGTTREFRGEVHGHLVWPPRGTEGFGYDAMFVPDGHDRTFGEMTADEKHFQRREDGFALSHRARSMDLFVRGTFGVQVG